jgi:protein-S-isoprenylcysteine O-methyltransferase Ste14
MLQFGTLWIPMLVAYGVGAVAFALASRGKRPYLEPRLLEYLGEDGASLWWARRALEVAIFATAVFTPIAAFTPGGSHWSFVFGLLFWLIGVAVLGSAAYSRGSDTAVLLKSGAYAYSRNPILAGRALVLGGLLIMGLGNSAAFMLFALAVFASFLAALRWIEAEEAFLERECGEEYLEYRKWVPRFFLFF